MEEPIEQYEYKGFTIRIEYDPDPPNPRTDYDQLGVMVFERHDRYVLGDNYDDHGYRYESYEGWEEMCQMIEDDEQALVILPLYVYDHGGCYGITIKTGDPSFLQGWCLGWDEDSDIGGVIFARRKNIDNIFGPKRITGELLVRVVKSLQGEVETYNKYLDGQIFGYVIGDEDDDDLKSCWSFFDMDECKSEAESHVDHLAGGVAEEAAKKAIEIKERDERRRKMGYDFDLIESQIFVSKEKFADFRARAVDLGNVADDISVDVSDEKFVSEIFRNHGFTAIFDEPGNLIDVEQDCEKLISQAQLLDAVAPFCAEGSFVGAYGEDGEIWRWALDPEKGMREEPGRVVYDKK